MSTISMVPYEDIRPGDHIRITRRIKVGLKKWESVVTGTVIRTERLRNGLHVERSNDDKAFQDTILLTKDGPTPEESKISMDEYTFIERI